MDSYKSVAFIFLLLFITYSKFCRLYRWFNCYGWMELCRNDRLVHIKSFVIKVFFITFGLTLTPSVVGLVWVTMCVGTELQLALHGKGKAPVWNWKADEMERPFRLIHIINPVTRPTSSINPDMIPTTVSTIELDKSPVTHKNTHLCKHPPLH